MARDGASSWREREEDAGETRVSTRARRRWERLKEAAVGVLPRGF